MLAAHVHLVRKDQIIFGTPSEPYHLTVFQCDLCSLIQAGYTNQCTMWYIGRLLLYRFFLYYIVFRLELLLFYANPRGDTNPTAHLLMERFGSLAGVLDALPATSQMNLFEM